MTPNSGRVKPPGSRPTLKDVGRAAGVDPSVVSKLLNDDPSLSISEATRERVLRAIDDLGYRTNLRARGLRLSRTWTIAAVFPDLRNPVYVPIVEGARRRAAERGYGLVLSTADEPNGGAQRSAERLLLDHLVDGLLLASGEASDSLMKDLASGSAPVLVVSRVVPGIESCLLVDDAAGSRMAADHLCGLGHRSIAVLSGPKSSKGDSDSSLRRVRAFTDRCTEYGAKAVAVYGDTWDANAGLEAIAGLLAKRNRPTAVFATTVMLAVGALRGIHEAGIAIPEDISVISLHDTEAAAFTEPPLTTVRLPMEELGRHAVDRLLDKIDGAEVGQEVVATPPELVLRASTAAPLGK